MKLPTYFQNVDPQALEMIVEYIYNPESLCITEDNVQVIYIYTLLSSANRHLLLDKWTLSIEAALQA